MLPYEEFEGSVVVNITVTVPVTIRFRKDDTGVWRASAKDKNLEVHKSGLTKQEAINKVHGVMDLKMTARARYEAGES